MPTLRQALPDDWDAVRKLLLASELPVDDLGPDRLDGFLIAEDDELVVGAQAWAASWSARSSPPRKLPELPSCGC
jgi:hypothetical protein